MTVTAYQVKPVDREVIKDFTEHWHYSKSINGLMISHCFGLYDGDTLIGAMIYGKLGMANVWKKYADTPDDLLELRRLCCIDDTPKNTESYFIGQTLRWLTKNTTVKTIVSYADTMQGHEGIIYKASNFTHVGRTSPGRVIVRHADNRQYHDKAIRTKYKGDLKPFAKALKNDLDNGRASYVKTTGKHIYVYNLAQRRR